MDKKINPKKKKKTLEIENSFFKNVPEFHIAKMYFMILNCCTYYLNCLKFKC